MTAVPLWLDALAATLVVTGAAFALIGSWGLAKLSDFLKRLHGPTKATTLGVGCLLVASSVFFSVTGEGLSLHELLVSLFLFITAPISAHLLARAALHLDLPAAVAPPPPEASASPAPVRDTPRR